MARRIIFIGEDAKVGCSSMCTMLACGLVECGKKVVVIDLCVGDNLTSLWGLENVVKYDIFDVLCNKCRINQALLSVNMPLLFCLPSAENTKTIGDYSKFFEIVEELSSCFDFILLDCPTYFFPQFYVEAEVILVSVLENLVSLEKLISVLVGNKNTTVRILLNKCKWLTNKNIKGIDCFFRVPKIRNFFQLISKSLNGEISPLIKKLTSAFLGGK
ncbi:MAG: AAA family ATPase [Clostridia bacterium]|nr:AAA family ATPase [Clostridia bacterium]